MQRKIKKRERKTLAKIWKYNLINQNKQTYNAKKKANQTNTTLIFLRAIFGFFQISDIKKIVSKKKMGPIAGKLKWDTKTKHRETHTP